MSPGSDKSEEEMGQKFTPKEVDRSPDGWNMFNERVSNSSIA